MRRFIKPVPILVCLLLANCVWLTIVYRPADFDILKYAFAGLGVGLIGSMLLVILLNALIYPVRMGALADMLKEYPMAYYKPKIGPFDWLVLRIFFRKRMIGYYTYQDYSLVGGLKAVEKQYDRNWELDQWFLKLRFYRRFDRVYRAPFLASSLLTYFFLVRP